MQMVKLAAKDLTITSHGWGCQDAMKFILCMQELEKIGVKSMEAS
jgi:uridine phosphorylase